MIIMTKSRNSAGWIIRCLLSAILCVAGGALAAFSLAQLKSPPRVTATPYLLTTSSETDTSLMPAMLRQPVDTTFRWLASFNPSVARRHIARAASSSAGRFAPARTVNLAPFVSDAVVPTISPRVTDLPAVSPFTIVSGQREEGELTNREPKISTNPLEHDPVVQTTVAETAAMPPVQASFEGINNSQACNGCIPPDPTGAVGPNHYVQMVNSHFAIYSKTGQVISSSKPINSLWAATPNSTCATHNNGDPIVIYDQLADRWLISQFTVQSGTEDYAECIAISQTPDPAGAYWLYQFDESPDVFHDYPHIALWPDGYYMSTNLFPNSGLLFSSGAGAWAFERAKMLAGQPARYVYFDETPLATQTYTPGGQLPASLDGKALPPAGMPNYFVEVDNANQPNGAPDTGLHDEMHLWKFHVDWTNPANSTFGRASSAPAPVSSIPGQYAGNAGQPDFVIPIADYVPFPCEYASGPNCIPQKVTAPQPPEFLEALADRLMFRVTYRNFGDHEALVVSHTALAAADNPNGAARAGVRWYELRNLSSTPAVYQQSTFAPLDTSVNGPLWRWMGSAAMDHNGNLAIGYNASGPNYFPSLHYAGRLATDPLNELTQGEAVLFEGLGIEVAVPDYLQRNRWGDYSTLTVDPTDDCTFWYTNEYINTNTPEDAISSIDWHTRIGSFKFPTCVAATPPQLVTVVSRKNHGGNDFDIPLPLTGIRGVECRTGDINLVFTFDIPVSNCGTPTAGTVAAGPENKQCTVTLSGLTSGQYYQVGLSGVVSSTGGTIDIPGPQWGLLIGDVDATGRVDGNDVSSVQSHTRQSANADNFRNDVSPTGRIDGNDVSTTQSQTRTGLPSNP